ncbi:MAG: hypothetical protein MUQ65_03390 [Armatimonadetes bacterium]|nr:hypothetical protein [Armatimonadota bacterium]
MAWKYAAFSAMCPECTLDETAALASSVGIDGLEWRVTKKAPEPITEVSHWGVNRSTVDVNDIEADLKRAKEIADQRGLEMPVLGTYMKCDELPVVEAVMRAGASVGCRKLRVGPPMYDGSRPYQELFDQAARLKPMMLTQRVVNQRGSEPARAAAAPAAEGANQMAA